MPSSIMNIVVDCARPYELAQFWSQALHRPVDGDAAPDHDEVVVELAGGEQLYFAKVPEPKAVKNRLHLCLQPDVPRDDEVQRLLGLGAVVVDDRRRPDGRGWVVMGDPEGNEFCVLRSVAEWPESARV
jgi:hypothetical protein